MQGRKLARNPEDVGVSRQPDDQDLAGCDCVLGRRALAGGHIHTVGQNPSITDGRWAAAWQFRSTIL
jgi:hypothetical protein